MSWTVAVPVAVFMPLTRLTVARQEPSGRLLGGAKVMSHDWPGARVAIFWAGNGPERVRPGPSVSRRVPLRSTARSPVFFTRATMSGWPAASQRPVIEVIWYLVGG